MNPHSEQAEEIYRQNLVTTASVPRLALLLYAKMLKLLKQLQAPITLNQWRRQLQAVHQLLTHLLGVFSQSQAPAYLQLCQSHEALAQKLSQLFVQPHPDPNALKPIIATLETFQAAWQQQLNIIPRQPAAPPALNVKRHQVSE